MNIRSRNNDFFFHVVVFLILYYFYLELLIYSSNWFIDSFGLGKSIPTVTTFILLVLYSFNGNYGLRLVLCCTAVVVISLALSSPAYITIVKIILVFSLFKDMPLSKAIGFQLVSYSLALFSSILLIALYGNVSEVLFYSHKGYVPTLGFVNPNIVALYIFYFFQLVFAFFVLNSRKNMWISIWLCTLSFFIFSGFLFLLESRTQIVNMMMFIMLFLFMLKFDKYNIPYLILLFSLLSPFLFLILFSVRFEPIFTLNHILSERIAHSFYIFTGEGFPNLFKGADISEYLPVDMFPIRAVYESGVCYLFLCFFMSWLSITKLKRSQLPNKFIALSITSILGLWVNGVSESYIFVVPFSLGLFFIVWGIGDDHKTRFKKRI